MSVASPRSGEFTASKETRAGRVRRELAAVLGAEAVPSPHDVQTTFVNGVSLVRDLERTGQIDSDAARTLQHAMAALYINAVVARFAGDHLGVPLQTAYPPSFIEWALASVK